MFLGVTLFQVSSKFVDLFLMLIDFLSEFRRCFVEVSSKFRRFLSNIVELCRRFVKVSSKFRRSFIDFCMMLSNFVEFHRILSNVVEVSLKFCRKLAKTGFRIASDWLESGRHPKVASKLFQYITNNKPKGVGAKRPPPFCCNWFYFEATFGCLPL